MSDADRNLLDALKRHIWIVAGCLAAFLIAVVMSFVLIIRHFDLQDIRHWINDSKCNCRNIPTSHTHQQVNLAPAVSHEESRERTVRELLQKRWEMDQHDMRGVVRSAEPD